MKLHKVLWGAAPDTKLSLVQAAQVTIPAGYTNVICILQQQFKAL